MSTKDIVLTYRQQFKIEEKFAEMKDPAYIQTRPIRHWTRSWHSDSFIYLLIGLFGTISFEIEIESPSDRYSIF